MQTTGVLVKTEVMGSLEDTARELNRITSVGASMEHARNRVI